MLAVELLLTCLDGDDNLLRIDDDDEEEEDNDGDVDAVLCSIDVVANDVDVC